MRAYVLEKSSKNPTLQERPSPAPEPDEVLVQTLAVSIHPVDLETRAGKNGMLLPFSRPFIPGVDFVGTVKALGPGVTDLDVGAAVYGYRGIASMGAFAEELVVPRSELAVAPENVDASELAAIPLPALCALQALDEAQLSPGSRVLVHGGAGGVGSIAVQIFAAKEHHVIATASAKDSAWVQQLGATQVIDYKTTRFEDAAQDIDLVFDTVGGDTLKRSFKVVKPGGAVVSLSAMPDARTLRSAGLKVPAPMAVLLPMLGWSVRRKARSSGARFIGLVTTPSGSRLEQATHIAQQHPIQCRIDRVFPFEELAQAMDHVANGHARGRVVVTC